MPPDIDRSPEELEEYLASQQQTLASLLSVYAAMPRTYKEVESGTYIGRALEKYKLKQWGFVIVRCTYSSQEKWDKFVAVAKQSARQYFERHSAENLAVYDKMTWTIIEDAKTLDGASILDATLRFRTWVNTDGRREMQGTGFEADRFARYDFFMYVDEESLESVVDNEKARGSSGNFCTIVYEFAVMERERAREAGELEEDADPMDEKVELLESRKKISLGDPDSLVELYASLLDGSDSWYNIYVDFDDGNEGIAWGVGGITELV